MVKNSVFVQLSLFLVFASSPLLGQTAMSVRSDTLQYGKDAVGFRTKVISDYSRPALLNETGGARNILVAVWYPARLGVRRMKVADYLRISYDQMLAKKPSARDELIQEWTKKFGFTGKETTSATNILNAETAASADAEPLRTFKGIIVYSPGGGNEAFDNFLLCEVLASQGYVVAASPSTGFQQRRTVPTSKNLETAARDLEMVLGFVRESWPGGGAAKVGAMGYSWGGLAAMLVQMRNPGVNMVVSIDGSIASHEDKARQTAWFEVSAMRVPYLFYSASDTLEKHQRFLETVRYAPISHVHLPKMNHGDFQSFRYIVSRFQNEPEALADARRGYETVVNMAVPFFDWSLKRNRDGLDGFLPMGTPPSSGSSLTTKRALPAPPSETEFFDLILQDGPTRARKVYEDFRSRDPGLVLFGEQGLAEVAFSIFDNGKKREGIEVLKLDIEAYPRDYKLHGYLGSLYEESGEVQPALNEYAIALGMAMNDTREDPVQVQGDIALFRSLIEKLANLRGQKQGSGMEKQ
jgi:dienelactone hydrolase